MSVSSFVSRLGDDDKARLRRYCAFYSFSLLFRLRDTYTHDLIDLFGDNVSKKLVSHEALALHTHLQHDHRHHHVHNKRS